MVGLTVKQTNERGLGIFATQSFYKGDLIECCRVLVACSYEILLYKTNSNLRNYVFEWDKLYAIPTGYGCYYNHSYQPNAIHSKHFDLCEIHFIALRDILPNEEITFNYGGFPTCIDPMWFEVKNS